ncbi:MAG: hypothetical protein AABZ47_16370 [Planctomycetota bacterium]
MHRRSFHMDKRIPAFPCERERGFVLVVALLLLTLLIAVAAELVTLTSVETVVAARRHAELQHGLAVESTLLVLADVLDNRSRSGLLVEMDRTSEARLDLEIGPAKVLCTIRDDGGKLHPALFESEDRSEALRRKLRLLQTQKGLPHGNVRLRPVLGDATQAGPRFRWFDQLLDDAPPGSFFQVGDSANESFVRAVWSDVVTFWGDGRIDLRRVDPVVLEAALEDIRPGLAQKIMAARPADRSVDFPQIALAHIDSEIRERVAARLTFDDHRYALEIDTILGADRRKWYVVARIENGKTTVLHRSPVTW